MARKIKVHFTGDLNKRIYTNPYFEKTEKFFLRTQIARISQSTTLVPLNVYRLKEDEKNIIEENVPEDGDGPVPVPSTNEMTKLDNWCHFSKSILQCGRISKVDEAEE